VASCNRRDRRCVSRASGCPRPPTTRPEEGSDQSRPWHAVWQGSAPRARPGMASASSLRVCWHQRLRRRVARSVLRLQLRRPGRNELCEPTSRTRSSTVLLAAAPLVQPSCRAHRARGCAKRRRARVHAARLNELTIQSVQRSMPRSKVFQRVDGHAALRLGRASATVPVVTDLWWIAARACVDACLARSRWARLLQWRGGAPSGRV
jgi:hypothetical protein